MSAAAVVMAIAMVVILSLIHILRLAFYSIDGEYYDVDLDTFEFTPVDLAESAGRDFPLVELGIGLDGYGGEGTLADGRVVVLRTDGYERTGCLYIADPAQLEKDRCV